ncbi:MAG: FliM/FliN family flagellar motor switch protein [Thermoguttaceae bacterium]
MSELNFSALSSFIAAVKNGSGEAAQAFQRTFDTSVSFSAGSGGQYLSGTLREPLNSPALALLLGCGDEGIAIIIPKSTGLIPEWCDHPDATGKSKLSTFAQELGMNLLPDDFFPETFEAAVLHNATENLIDAVPGSNAGYLDLEMRSPTGTGGTGYLIWPLTRPAKLLVEKQVIETESIPPPPNVGGAPPHFVGDGAPNYDPFNSPEFGLSGLEHSTFGEFEKSRTLDDLPGYGRSILKVRISVAAVLARTRKPIKSVLELGVGSVIQFDKSCDEFLEIEVGQVVTIGKAEAVKVGEKFGFRISSIILPEERFRKVEVRHAGEYRVKPDLPQIIGKSPLRSFEIPKMKTKQQSSEK